jgi:hypothetical protein
MSELSERITEVAGESFEVETEEGRARHHSLSELIKADQYQRRLDANQATSLAQMGYRRVRMRPPGTTGPV